MGRGLRAPATVLLDEPSMGLARILVEQNAAMAPGDLPPRLRRIRQGPGLAIAHYRNARRDPQEARVLRTPDLTEAGRREIEQEIRDQVFTPCGVQ